MVTRDMPTISDGGHSHSTYSLSNLAEPVSTWAGTSAVPSPMFLGNAVFNPVQQPLQNDFLVRGQMLRQAAMATIAAEPIKAKPKKEEPTVTRRLVQVFIADPDENLPLDKAMLYSGSQKFTDATDQELFFEIDMQSILKAHNADRITIINKKVKDRTEYLEPAKIRDLKMVVVNVATF